MLDIVTDNDKIVYAGDRWNLPNGKVLNRWDLKSLADAEALAAQCNRDLAPREFLATDAGEGVSPRYDVIEAFKIGDEVGYGFNGDRYADGTITKISDSGRVITTSTGKRYYRRGQTGRWVQTGGTWTLSRGHHTTTNWEL